MPTKLYNICASTGKFSDRNGNTKNRYIRVGSVLKGEYALTSCSMLTSTPLVSHAKKVQAPSSSAQLIMTRPLNYA